MEPLSPQPGSTIDPRNAVGRERVTTTARRELLAGNNLALTDPRRMGKTVWLDVLCATPGDGLHAMKVDYEGVETSEGFLLRTVAAIGRHDSVPSKTKAKLRALFDGVELAAGPVSVKVGVSTRTPRDLLQQTIESVEEHLDDDIALVIAMDEVPVAIDNIRKNGNEGADAAHQLLQTLRNLRREAHRMRWIVAGSVGFHHVLRQCQATEGVINDLINLPLGPLDAGDADHLARRLMLGIERRADDEAVATMISETGQIPFLLHALAHGLYDAGTTPVSAEDVRNAFLAFMDDRDSSRAVTHLVTRLDPLYGDQARPAEALLDRVALERTLPLSACDVSNAILDDLVDDHYLLQTDGSIRWRYDVLRRIWAHRRRLG